MSKEKKYVAFYTADGYNYHVGTVKDDLDKWLKEHNIERVSENIDAEHRDIAVDALKMYYNDDDLEEKIKTHLINEHNLDEDTACDVADEVMMYLDDIDDFTFYEV